MNVDRPARRFRLPWQKRREVIPSDKDTHISTRVPLLNFLPPVVKGHVVAFSGEFVGTFLFLLFAMGGTNVVNAAPAEGANALDLAANPAKLMYIALCFGMSLAVNAWVFFRISGGLFNPAVTLGMMMVGATAYVRGAIVIVAQILGGIAAAALVSAMFPGDINVRTSLGGGTSVVQGLFIEMFLTAQLVFTIFMLAAEKHAGTFIAPIGIGLSLFIAELMGVYYTGGSVNPARSFGPAVVAGSFYSYHWIYWLGPVLGAILAATFYLFIKALEYETINIEADPQQSEVVGRKFDPVSGKEKIITREGKEVPVPGSTSTYHNSPIAQTGSPNGNTFQLASANSPTGNTFQGSPTHDGNVYHDETAQGSNTYHDGTPTNASNTYHASANMENGAIMPTAP
ncbi:aquaporin [Microthyrium microscopicum]|uniref:Aquaporin n=1 Tax=Microthyrium microscopicum TaxID=703497 RepID=A0A6A6TWB9_9PEZI|nr:aquaporin [Microthyrium microscopicum]